MTNIGIFARKSDVEFTMLLANLRYFCQKPNLPLNLDTPHFIRLRFNVLQLQIQRFIATLVVLFFLGAYIYSSAEEQIAVVQYDPFYSLDFPAERIEFWTSIGRSLVHFEIKETLENLNTIDEFSDESGLSLLEFRNFIAIKYACLIVLCGDTKETTPIVEYLDRLADYTRKSIRWQKEIFVTERFLSMGYAILGEFKKAEESLSLFRTEIEEKIDQWCRYNSIWDAVTIDYHAACIYAVLGKYDKAIEICEKYVQTDIESDPIRSKDIKVVDDFYTALYQAGIGRKEYRQLISEFQQKQTCFMQKGECSYCCILAFVVQERLNDGSSETNEFLGCTMFCQWFSKKGEWTDRPTAEHSAPCLVGLFIPLPLMHIDEDGICSKSRQELYKKRSTSVKVGERMRKIIRTRVK